MKNVVTIPLALGGLLFASAMAMLPLHVGAQTTLSTHTFDGGTALIDNTVPDGGTLAGGGNEWTADSFNGWQQDGSTGRASDLLLLPFSPVSGFEYTLTATVRRPDDGSNGWINVGFFDVGVFDQNSKPSALSDAFIWQLFNPDTGANDVVAHYNPSGGSTIVGNFNGIGPGGTAELSIVLDTTGGSGNWTASYFVDGTEYVSEQNIAASVESQLNGVGIGTDQGGDDGIRADSFELTQIPEPSVAALALGGLAGVLALRRRTRC